MINRTAVDHRAADNFIYAYDEETLHIQLRTGKEDVENVSLVAGDPYHWEDDKWQNQLLQMEKVQQDALYDYWKIAVKPDYRRLRYGFRLKQGEEILYFTERGLFVEKPEDISYYFCFPFLNSPDVFRAPGWVKDTVWYQIFPERFANGNEANDPAGALPWGSEAPARDNFFGGDLEGVLKHLDHLAALGVGGIYFTPIFKARSNHKYDTIDYFEIDPQFGTEEDLHRLVAACHERGIKVMLDAVFNHSGFYFDQFQDVLENGSDSPYKDWFHIREWPIVTEPEPNYDTFAFTKDMPKLKTENPEVKAYLLKVARYWVEKFDIDGWRLDVANEVDHAFWRDFRKTVKTIKPEIFILGEIWHDSMPWLRGDQFDSVMNYRWSEAALDFIAEEKIDAAAYQREVSHLLMAYPENVNEVLFNLLGSHDTPRLLTRCGGDKAKALQLMALQLTFPGTPCIYYGDEIGMAGGGDPGCRACMEWDEAVQDRDMFEAVSGLIRLRREHRVLGSCGDLRFFESGDPGVTAFRRFDMTDEYLVIVNRTAEDKKVALPKKYQGTAFRNLTGGGTIESHSGSLNIGPQDYKILKMK